MAQYPECRVLAVIGSGETSPTMVAVHKELLSRLGLRRPRAVLLATSYAFQENAADVSARAQRYFARSVGLDVRVAPGTSHDADDAVAPPMIGRERREREAAEISSADWVFSGPGSPSYALAHWRAGPVAGVLRDRVQAGNGVTVLAFAAAATAGRFTLPVYEIYKAGGAARWLAGLDLLGTLGLTAAVVPHYDNAEGRHYDTRYCYLGERRLAAMERQLLPDAAILGVDEHTAVLIDLRSGQVDIRGRGGMTVRRAGNGTVLPSGTCLSVADLRDLARGAGPAAHRTRSGGAEALAIAGVCGIFGVSGFGEARGLPLPEVMAEAERGFGAAAGDRDAYAMVRVILELETAIRRWDADTDEDQGTEQARALLRSLIGRLGRAAQDGLTRPWDRLRPAVEPLVALRDTLRREGSYAAADAIRQALTAAGLDVRDTPEGTVWQPAETA
ncbi:MAG: hypothetical protein ACRDOA_20695 [Streptosporangiaceae bacterium]